MKRLLILSIFIFSNYSFSKYVPPPPYMPTYSFPAQTTYQIIVYLINGDTLRGESAIYSNSVTSSIKINGQTITPNQTQSIEANDLVGVPYKSKWLFKISGDKLKAYKTKPEITESGIDYLRVDSTFVRYSLFDLPNYVKDNPASLSLAKGKVRGRLAAIGMSIAGITFLVIGISKSTHETQKNTTPEVFKPYLINEDENSSGASLNAYIGIGTGLLLAALIPHLVTRHNDIQAIDVFNDE